MERCEVFTADRGYDDTEKITDLWKEHKTKAIIDIRNCWGNKKEVRMFEDRNNIIGNDNFGTIYCYCPEIGKQRIMSNAGFEKIEKQQNIWAMSSIWYIIQRVY